MIVGVLAIDNVVGYELMIPGQIFGMANIAAAESARPEGDGEPRMSPFEVRLCGQRSTISTAADFAVVEIRAPFGLDALADADLVIVPGTRSFLEEPPAQVLSLLADIAGGGGRVASFCVGAFTLAAAGLLDGRRATTHWQFAGELSRRYPNVDVDPRVLFIDEGQVLTSAGVSSGIDLCLHLVRQHCGPELARRTARRVVVSAWRDGGQAQYMENPGSEDGEHPLQGTVDWMRDNSLTALELKDIATHAAVSVRTLNRQFREYVGTTPLGMLTAIRVDGARRLLETTKVPMEEVAMRAGFGSYASLRCHFRRSVGLSPQKYRNTYAVAR
ncbi:GlxA family transcriptional regulator [Mycolicibacterium sp. CBM1]